MSQLGRIQKWVTLQPNNEYNNYEACNVKARLDLRAVAEEIAAELGAVSDFIALICVGSDEGFVVKSYFIRRVERKLVARRDLD